MHPCLITKCYFDTFRVTLAQKQVTFWIPHAKIDLGKKFHQDPWKNKLGAYTYVNFFVLKMHPCLIKKHYFDPFRITLAQKQVDFLIPHAKIDLEKKFYQDPWKNKQTINNLKK